MSVANFKFLGALCSKTHNPALRVIGNNFFRVSATLPFSTSSQCISQSSEREFLLRHQVSSEKKTNKNWVIYRVASLGLLGGMVGCFLAPGNAVIDFATVTLLVHHNYFGLKSVIADYAPLVFKDWFTSMLYFTWLLISIVTLGLLYSFNYNNIGFSKALTNFFKL
ncbi:succinate dehydrogenase [ubiquinone] cytochrome b small subunit, mitochondrial-like [Clavelina lepadiformis]|uniref:Succinate dehydrogenase [ubiquinone] cytochrome b small subunit n=1 Tax=Clavelina lepadiformis TaxID=159417 RepID=A0ABP0GV69_CLALP